VLELFRSEEGAFDAALLRLLDDPGTGAAIAALGLLVAVGVGAVHALGPGHGKALIGAYLAGTRGRAADAVALGVLVAAMHTASVLAFGFALHSTQRLPTEGTLGSALPVATGLAIAAVGGAMLRRGLRQRRQATARRPPVLAAVAAGGIDGHIPHHAAHAGADHHHHELPAGVAPLSRAGVLALAGSGGLLPSPAAFLVLVAALAAGRAGYGVALVGAFSVGLALTLTAVGLAVLWGRDALVRNAGRRPAFGWLTRRLPIVAAAAVTLGGILLAGNALATW
jgi:nickel/cobalt transporter (NicO) family protein